MSTQNISRGGVFIQGDPLEYPELQVGTSVELIIFNPDDPGQDDVTLTALVVRRETGGPTQTAGFGLQFTKICEGGHSLDRLIEGI